MQLRRSYNVLTKVANRVLELSCSIVYNQGVGVVIEELSTPAPEALSTTASKGEYPEPLSTTAASKGEDGDHMQS